MDNFQLSNIQDIHKKSIWANRYSNRLVNLSDKVFVTMQSLEWDSKEYQKLRALRDKITYKIYLLARYSGFITSNAMKILKSK